MVDALFWRGAYVPEIYIQCEAVDIRTFKTDTCADFPIDANRLYDFIAICNLYNVFIPDNALK